MGKRNTNQCKPTRGRSIAGFNGGSDDDDGDDTVKQCSKSMSNLKLRPPSIKGQTLALEGHLEKLFEKRGSTREKALSSIVDMFTNNIQHRFVINRCITLLHRCLNSIKQGSTREIYLASHVIGLLSLTVGCTDGLAHEILEDTVSLLSQALQSDSEPLKITPLLDCLAITTFVGGNGAGESERSLQIMWQFIHPKLEPHVVASEPTSQVLTAAISAWSFLLAAMDSWSINAKLWRESMSYFSNLLYNDDLSLRMAVGEALALIFEIGSLEKFFHETNISSGSSSNEESEGHVSMEELKDTILNQVRTLSMETVGNDSTEKSLIKSHQTLFHDVSRVLEGCYTPEARIKIRGDMLTISTWSHLVQVNYLKRFLGGGFVKHAQENELFRDFLELTPKRNRQLGGKQHISSDEKVAIHYVFQPGLSVPNSYKQKKLDSSVLNKAKTQLMNKKRMLSQARNDGYYAVGLAEENI